MLFSILVPVYNVEEYLPACLKSIEGQSFTDYELILVDDGSTDGSGALCDEYQRRHPDTVVIHKENAGLISARRRGIAAAQGEYCLFCDSDDLYENGAFQKLADVVRNNDVDLVLFNANVYNGETKAIFFEHVLDEGFVRDKTVIYDKLLLSYALNAMWIKAVRRECLDADRDYTAFYSCNFGEDLLQTMPMVRNAEKIFYLDKALYDYREMAGMMHKFNPRYYWSYKAVNGRVREYLEEIPLADKEEKLCMHLLVAAYGGTTQIKYTKAPVTDEIKKIADDGGFRRAYETVKRAGYFNRLNLKQRLMLHLLYHRHFRLIAIMMSMRG